MVLRVSRWTRFMRRRFGPAAARTTKRMFRPTRRARQRWSLRRFVRRPMRTELKYNYTVSTAQTNISPNSFNNQAVSPLAMSQGTGEGQRVGNQVKFIKVDLRLWVRNNSATSVVAPEQQTAQSRIIIWTPRVEVSRVFNYFTTIGLNLLTLLDFNVLTVYRDHLITLSPPYMNEAAGADIAGGPAPYKVFRKYSVSFPRKVTFSNVVGDNADIDDDKDVLYCTIVNSDLSTTWFWNSKLWYKDA